jgi:tripartite-type tricarboxylate transporter receptor subunit TctC
MTVRRLVYALAAIGAELVFALGLALVLAPASHAQSIADFYRGKTLHMVIGYGPGGGYDLYGRLAAEFLGRHIPGNPMILPQNMPGNSSLRAVEYLLDVAPKDGSYLGSVQQALAMTVVTDDKSRIDLGKLRHIGRLTSNIDIAVALPQAHIKSFEDAKARELVVGADQATSMAVVYARALNKYAGARLRIVKGYPGSAEIQLAAERGEVEVNGSYSLPAVLFSHPDWVRDGTATILYQNALKRFPQMPNVPTVLDLVSGEEGKAMARVIAGTAEIGRSILTAGAPPERLAALRLAFQDMLKDPDFIAACRQRNLMLDPGSGEEMDAITQETLNLPKPFLAALRGLLKE